LKNLKHYRWVRNQISHEPECTEQNMCDPEDELWLKEFYDRIMNQTDPLALYRQATRPRPVARTTPRPVQSTPTYTQPSNNRNAARKNFGCATIVIVSSLVVAGIVLVTQLI
jgi:hypothetical protein